MRYFALLDYQYVVLGVLVAVLGIVALVTGFLGVPFPRRDRPEAARSPEFAEGIRFGDGPVPLLVVLVIAGCAVFAVLYLYLIGLCGPAF